MVVDLDAFDANADDLARRAGGTPLRVASKSLRVPALLSRALAHDAFSGVLAYSLREALWLHARTITDDIVMGYPRGHPRALAEMVHSASAASPTTLKIHTPPPLNLLQPTTGPNR